MPPLTGGAQSSETQRKSRLEVTGDGGRRDGELVFNGYRVSVWEGEKILELDSGDGCTVWRL